MNTRIAAVRKTAHFTQEEFAARIGLSRNFVWMLENGDRIPSDRTINDICREFNINESWLRTGEGEMQKPRSRVDEIGEIVNTALEQEPEAARRSLAARLAKLSDAEIMLLVSLLDRRFPD